MITQTIDLNMIPGKEPCEIHVNQGDVGDKRLLFVLKKDKEDYTPNGNYKIQGKTPNGEKFSHDCVIEAGTVKANLTSDMTNESGQIPVQLVEIDGDNRTGTQVFILNVQRKAK